jgi:hypothetical protein
MKNGNKKQDSKHGKCESITLQRFGTCALGGIVSGTEEISTLKWLEAKYSYFPGIE